MQVKKTKYAKTTAFFHLATQNEKTKAQLEVIHNTIQIYCYDKDTPYCALRDIETQAKQLIGKLPTKLQNPRTSSTIDRHYEILEKRISSKVIEIHSMNHTGTPIAEAAFNNVLPFSDFFSVLNSDPADDLDEQYFEWRIINDLNRYYQEFCFENKSENWTESEQKKMSDYLYYFNSLSGRNLKSFVQNIRPHKVVSYKTLQDYKDKSLNDDEFIDGFLTILFEIRASDPASPIEWFCLNRRRHKPTSIRESNSETSKMKLCQNLIETSLDDNVELSYDADTLVTQECNVDDIFSYANNILKVEEDKDPLENLKVTFWKKISLIDLNTAKDRLND